MDGKEELEIKKLEYEIKNLKGRKVRAWIQALAPILAVGGTILVLYLTDFISTSEKLLEIRKYELADTISNYKNTIESQKSLLKKDSMQKISLLRSSKSKLEKAIETSKDSLSLLRIRTNSLNLAIINLEEAINKSRDTLNHYRNRTKELAEQQTTEFKGLKMERGVFKNEVDVLNEKLKREGNHLKTLNSLIKTWKEQYKIPIDLDSLSIY